MWLIIFLLVNNTQYLFVKSCIPHLRHVICEERLGHFITGDSCKQILCRKDDLCSMLNIQSIFFQHSGSLEEDYLNFLLYSNDGPFVTPHTSFEYKLQKSLHAKYKRIHFGDLSRRYFYIYWIFLIFASYWSPNWFPPVFKQIWIPIP